MARIARPRPAWSYSTRRTSTPRCTTTATCHRSSPGAASARGIAYGGHEQTTAFVPKVEGADYSASHHRAEMVEFTIPFTMVYDNPRLIAGSQLNDNQYNARSSSCSTGSAASTAPAAPTTSSGRSSTTPSSRRNSTNRAGSKATFDAIKRRAYGFDGIFDQDARPITDLVDQFVRPGQLSCVPTYHVNNSRSKTTVVLSRVDARRREALEQPRTSSASRTSPRRRHGRGPQLPHRRRQRPGPPGHQGSSPRPPSRAARSDSACSSSPRTPRTSPTLCSSRSTPRSSSISATGRDFRREHPDEPGVESALHGKGQMVVYSPDNSEPVEIQGLSSRLTRHGRGLERENRLPGPNVTVSRADVSISTTVK